MLGNATLTIVTSRNASNAPNDARASAAFRLVRRVIGPVTIARTFASCPRSTTVSSPDVNDRTTRLRANGATHRIGRTCPARRLRPDEPDDDRLARHMEASGKR